MTNRSDTSMNHNMPAKFSVEFDGQEAFIIVSALLEQAGRCQHPFRASYNRTIAEKVTAARQDFQRRHGERIMARYEEAAHGARP